MRDQSFRRSVLGVYGWRCSMSGFGSAAAGQETYGTVEAAHVKPVGAAGPDVVSNGIALTPTLHALFDLGMFTFEAYRGRLRAMASPHLASLRLGSIDAESRLRVDGAPVFVPADRNLRPAAEFLEFHRRVVYAR